MTHFRRIIIHITNTYVVHTYVGRCDFACNEITTFLLAVVKKETMAPSRYIYTDSCVLRTTHTIISCQINFCLPCLLLLLQLCELYLLPSLYTNCPPYILGGFKAELAIDRTAGQLEITKEGEERTTRPTLNNIFVL